MNRFLLVCPVVALMSDVASAQTNARERLRPITASVRHAGTLHLGTGKWTRAPSAQALAGRLEIVYANTCISGYFGGQLSGVEIWTDEGAIPDSGQIPIASTSIAGGFDANPGCAAAYEITGFQIGYCTHVLSFACDIQFFDNYEPVGTYCALPGTPVASFQLTGLPASQTTGVETCWTIGFDLTGTSQAFALTGTGSNTNLFGWSFAVTSQPSGGGHLDGPIIAGGLMNGGTSPQPCTGTDATRWDNGTASIAWPVNRSQTGNLVVAHEEGTGMLTLDAYRVDPGKFDPNWCYYFGGNPLGSFHLELYADPMCPECSCATGYCFPSEGGVIACPCGNDPVPGSERGCNNSVGTGGAQLTVNSLSGTASVSNDTVQLIATDERPNALSVFLQGDANNPQGASFGDGVLCVAGSLLRLNGPGGSHANVDGALTYPNPGFPLSITARAQQLGQPISPGSTRYYQTYYRDPDPNFCPSPQGSTWNVTNALAIPWQS